MKKMIRKIGAVILAVMILATTITGCMSAKAAMGATGVGLNDAVVARMIARIGLGGDEAVMLSQAYEEVGLSEMEGNAIPGSAGAWSSLAHERAAAGNNIITLSGIGGTLSYEVAALDHMYQDGAAFYDKAGTLVVLQDRIVFSLGNAGTTEEEGVRAALLAFYGIDPGENLRIENETNPIFSLSDGGVLVVSNTNGSGIPVCAVLIPCPTPVRVEETEETEEEVVEESEEITEAESEEIETIETEDETSEEEIIDTDESQSEIEETDEGLTDVSEDETESEAESSEEAETSEISEAEETASSGESIEAVTESAADVIETTAEAIETVESSVAEETTEEIIATSEETETEVPAETSLEEVQPEESTEETALTEETETPSEEESTIPEIKAPVLPAAEETPEIHTVKVSVEKNSNTQVNVKQNDEHLGSADSEVSAWKSFKSIFTGNDGTVTEVDVEKNGTVELEVSDMANVGTVEITKDGQTVTVDLSAVSDGDTIVVNADAEEVKLNGVKKTDSASVRAFTTYDEYAASLIGSDIVRTDATLDFYNTFVDSRSVRKDTTIESLFTTDVISENNADLIFDLNPTQLTEEAPIYKGADGYYYAVTTVPSVQNQEPMDFQAANRFYTDYGARYEDIEYLGSGVYRIPASRFEECYTVINAENEDESVEFVLGLRIQTLYTYEEEEAAGVKAVPTRVTYPDGSVSEIITLVDLETGTAATEIFENGMEFLFSPDYYSIALSVNSNQSAPAWIMCSGNFLIYSIGDPRSVEKIDAQISLNPEAFDVGMESSAAGSKVLRSASGVKGNWTHVFKAAPQPIVDTTKLNFGDLYDNKAVFVDGSKISDDLAVGDTFYWLDDEATIRLAGWNDATDSAGNFHRGIGGLTTRLAQGMSFYNLGLQGEVTTWFKNSLTSNADGSTIPGYQQMTDSAVLQRIGANYASGSIGGQQRFGYITVNPLTTPTRSTGNKTIDLGGTYVAFSCMHAWSGLSTGSSDYQQVIAAIQDFTDDTMTSRDFGFSTHGAADGHNPAVDAALTIAMKVTNIVEENGVKIVSLKACTSVLRVGGTIADNYQCAFSTIKIAYKPAVRTGTINMVKRSARPEITTGNSCYDMTGIQYTVYTDSACTKVAKRSDNGESAIFTLDKDGRTTAIPVAVGSYWIKESYNPEGSGYYTNAAASNEIKVTVENPNPDIWVTSDIPKNDPLAIEIEKQAAVPSAVTDLSGCEYTVRFYQGQYGSVTDLPAAPDQEWVIQTVKTPAGKYVAMLDDAHLVSGESAPFGKNAVLGTYTIPLGTLTVEETKAPYGFKIAGSEMYNPVTGEQFEKVGETFLFNLADENDGVFVKNSNLTSDGEEGIKLLQAELSLSPEIGTRAHDVMTGTNHALAEENTEIVDTVSYKYLFPETDYIVKGILMDKETGAPVLVNGEEVVFEQPFTTGESDSGSVDVKFSFDARETSGALVVFEKLYKAGSDVIEAFHEDLNDEGQTIYISKIGTTAVSNLTEDHVTGEHEKVTITDTVSYKGLEIGREYTMVGTLMDRETNAPIILGGEKVVERKPFVPENTEGTCDVTFIVSTKGLKGTELVVFEECYIEDDKLVAEHKDINDEGQTIYIPAVRTTVHDAKTELNHTNAEVEAVLVDTVFYEHLLPGREYSISGILMNKATGEPLLNESGEEIRSGATFTAKESSGSEDVTFFFNAELLKGETIVVFENLYYKGIEIAAHADLTDEDQTDYIPEIHTMATDLNTRDHLSNATDDMVIYDEVFYSGLKPETKYIVRGTLIDKETGTLLLDSEGKEITVATPFVSEKGETASQGSVIVEFNVKGSLLKNKTVVVFEDLYTSEKLVAVHADLNDEAQTIYIPEIRTLASDKKTGDHYGELSESAEIQDEVFYENLIPGKEYTIEGVLMLKEDGSVLAQNGQELRESKTFTPTTSSGSEFISFTVDSTLLSGRTVVVFEDIKYNGVSIAVHADIEDEGQSIHFMKARTKARDEKKGGNLLTFGKDTVIIDTVSYENLIPGKTYSIKGVLVNKETREETGITGYKEFTPDSASGETEVKFTMDVTADLKDMSFVIFEEVFDENDVLIGEHKDINDEDQTVYVHIGTAVTTTVNRRNSPTPILGIEKDFSVLLILFGASILLTIAGIVLARKLKKK